MLISFALGGIQYLRGQDEGGYEPINRKLTLKVSVNLKFAGQKMAKLYPRSC